MKRFWSAVLCLVMMFSAFSVNVFSATTYYEAGFDYEKVSGTAKIVNYYGLGGELVIPETLGGLPVAMIPDGAVSCQADTQITSVSLPKTLTDFSASAIVGNYSLEKIILAEDNPSFSLIDGVLYNASRTRLVLYPAKDARTSYEVLGGTVIIESSAFYGAKNLEKIGFPVSLKTIQNAQTNQAGVFENCTALKTVSFPFGLINIGDYAFMGCSSLTSVFFPDSAAKLKIGMGAFLNCPNLLSVRLYSNVESIGVEAFGIISAINPAGMMETNVLDGFYLYAVNNTAGAKYASGAGVGYRELRQTGDFSSNARLFMPKAQFPESQYLFTSVKNYTESDFADLRTCYFSSASYTKGWRIDRRLASGVVLPEEFSENVLYSIPAASLADFDETVYLFAVNEKTGAITYVPSYIGTAPDAWGTDSTQIEFETNQQGPFLAISATPEAGELNNDAIVDVNDVVLLAQSVAGWETEYNYLSADVNGNAELTVDDVVLLAQSVAGWDVELSTFAENI